MIDLNEIEQRLLAGDLISRQEATELARWSDLDELCDVADRVCRHFHGNRIDSCSIVNARSGMCGEDCKWCAQATRHKTGCATYNFLDEEEALRAARINRREGIQRFSLVTSGRTVTDKDLDTFCHIYRRIAEETGLYLCASMGLLNRKGMEKLKEAGVKRYHCNMETSSRLFPTLCSTHTPEDKKQTIRAAREAGLKVCSGGIIGMGETMEDRLDFAFELRELNVDSVPMNILNPIPGTPLEGTPLISEEDIIRTGALWRLIMPRQSIRFAGGRMRLSEPSMRRLLRGGLNGVLMGDMLTTISNTVAEDRNLFESTGWKF